MRQRRGIRAVIATVIAALVVLVMPGTAFAWGTKSACDTPNDTPEVSHVNRWGWYSGTWIDVYNAACINAGSATKMPYMEWIAQPRLSFPSKNIFGLIETVEVADPPWISNTFYSETGQVEAVRWRTTLHSCAGSGVAKICANDTFRITVGLGGSQICYVKNGPDECDAWKQW